MLRQEDLNILTAEHLVPRSLALRQKHDVVDGQTARNTFITKAAELQKRPEVTSDKRSVALLHGIISLATRINWDTAEGMQELLTWIYPTREVVYQEFYEEVARQRAQEEGKATPSDTPTS